MEAQGLVQVYTGNGKGKSTAAFGQAMRAAGRGLKVVVIQFVKGDSSCGEHRFAARYGGFALVQPNKGDCFRQSREELGNIVQQTLSLAREAVVGGEYDLVVLDEVFVAVQGGFLSTQDVVGLIESRPARTELVLTGRGAPEEVLRRADLVTEMVAVKHPFDRGVRARKGIEC